MDRNVAVVGSGYWGKNLVRTFSELGVLHTICDSSSQVIRELDALYPDVNKATDYGAVLASEEIRAVVVASPAALHYSMAREALLSGKDVFVESAARS